MAVIANIYADPRERSFKCRVTKIARFKIKLFPKPGSNMGDVVLAVLTKVFAVRIDDSRSVVINPGYLLFVNRNDNDHAVLLCNLLHQLDGGTIGNLFNRVIPS